MTKELVLVEQGKPVLQKDLIKIVKAMRSDGKALPYMLYDFFQLCESRKKLESSVSIILKNIFENMKAEIVVQVAEAFEIERTPVLIREISGYTVLFFEEERGFTVTCPSLLGCGTEGDTEEEATRNAKEAIEAYLECAKKHRVLVRQ